jgi:hypothetical protein
MKGGGLSTNWVMLEVTLLSLLYPSKNDATFKITELVIDHYWILIHAAGSFSLDTCLDPVVVETIAALRATEYCRNRGFSNIILEGNSLQVVQSLAKTDFNWTQHGQIMEDIREIMRSFPDWLVWPIFLLVWVFNMIPIKYGLIVFRGTVYSESSIMFL